LPNNNKTRNQFKNRSISSNLHKKATFLSVDRTNKGTDKTLPKDNINNSDAHTDNCSESKNKRKRGRDNNITKLEGSKHKGRHVTMVEPPAYQFMHPTTKFDRDSILHSSNKNMDRVLTRQSDKAIQTFDSEEDESISSW